MTRRDCHATETTVLIILAAAAVLLIAGLALTLANAS